MTHWFHPKLIRVFRINVLGHGRTRETGRWDVYVISLRAVRKTIRMLSTLLIPQSCFYTLTVHANHVSVNYSFILEAALALAETYLKQTSTPSIRCRKESLEGVNSFIAPALMLNGLVSMSRKLLLESVNEARVGCHKSLRRLTHLSK